MKFRHSGKALLPDPDACFRGWRNKRKTKLRIKREMILGKELARQRRMERNTEEFESRYQGWENFDSKA